MFFSFILYVFFFHFILPFRFSTTNTMGSTARIQIGARNDRNDEHVAGRVLYIGNLYIYYICGIFFKSPWTTCCCGKHNGHGPDFRGKKNEYRPKNGTNENLWWHDFHLFILFYNNMHFGFCFRATGLNSLTIQPMSVIRQNRFSPSCLIFTVNTAFLVAVLLYFH